MKKLLLALLCISTVGAAFPAFAGPDWQLIEQARKAKHAELQQAAASKDQPAGTACKMDKKMHHAMMDGMASKDQQTAVGAKADLQPWSGIYNGH